jgi:hypothetical protein
VLPVIFILSTTQFSGKRMAEEGSSDEEDDEEEA